MNQISKYSSKYTIEEKLTFYLSTVSGHKKLKLDQLCSSLISFLQLLLSREVIIFICVLVHFEIHFGKKYSSPFPAPYRDAISTMRLDTAYDYCVVKLKMSPLHSLHSVSVLSALRKSTLDISSISCLMARFHSLLRHSDSTEKTKSVIIVEYRRRKAIKTQYSFLVISKGTALPIVNDSPNVMVPTLKRLIGPKGDVPSIVQFTNGCSCHAKYILVLFAIHHFQLSSLSKGITQLPPFFPIPTVDRELVAETHWP